jgi:hypothetical protein
MSSLNKVKDNLKILRVQLQASLERETNDIPLEDDEPSSTAVTTPSTDLVQHLDDILEECNVLKALIERKHISSPGLLDIPTPSSSIHKYSPLEVSELLTQNETALQNERTHVDIPQELRTESRKANRLPKTAPTTPLRISSRSPPITPKSPERSASPHLRTMEEAFAKEDEDRVYRNLCDDELGPQTVTILDYEDETLNGSRKASARNAAGNTSNSWRRQYFRGRYISFASADI